MAEKRRILEVNGHRIEPGASLFDTYTEQVMWYTGMREGYVRLESLSNVVEIPEHVFCARIIDDSLHIESRPLRLQSQE